MRKFNLLTKESDRKNVHKLMKKIESVTERIQFRNLRESHKKAELKSARGNDNGSISSIKHLCKCTEWKRSGRNFSCPENINRAKREFYAAFIYLWMWFSISEFFMPCTFGNNSWTVHRNVIKAGKIIKIINIM